MFGIGSFPDLHFFFPFSFFVETDMASVHQYSAVSADGSRTVSLSEFRGRILVIVNTASMCGFSTANMESLCSLQREFGGSVQVLPFPCSQFANQEPKTSCEVRDWARDTFAGGGEFPWFEKVKVKGPHAHPLFIALQAALGPVRWNFTKFICSIDGIPVLRLDPAQCGSELRDAVKRLIDTGSF